MKLAILFTITVLSLPSAAVAADFTFDVPVRIQNTPSIQAAWLSCIVSRTSTYGTGGGDLIGRNEVSIPLSGGSFDGTVTVEVNATGINPASSARSYSCSIRANGSARTGATYAAQSGNFREVFETATGQTLEAATIVARGPLP